MIGQTTLTHTHTGDRGYHNFNRGYSPLHCRKMAITSDIVLGDSYRRTQVGIHERINKLRVRF